MAALTPTTPDELAEILASAAAERRPVTPWGAGQHQHLGAAAQPDALIVQTTALNRVLEYAPADLTVTVEAGARLADIQDVLQANGQWLPWNPPGAGLATIGGLLAAGRSGPLRLGYGTPRDWLLGAHVALGDGRLIKSGGKVVKNVAGYDSHKLHIGALGTLGVLLSVTFKIAPLPEADLTALACYDDLSQAYVAVAKVRERPLSPVSSVIISGPLAQQLYTGATAGQALVLTRFMGIRAAVDRHMQVASALGLVASADAAALWRTIAEFATPTPSVDLILRIGARPAALAAMHAAINAHAPAGASALAEPGVGRAYAHWPLDDENGARLAALRRAIEAYEGYAVVEYAPAQALTTLDAWGPAPATLAIMQSLKAKWDPANILNPGRYLGGI